MKKVINWGDQGNGMYRNPILNADFPDSDVEQFGDTYYMISSKQNMSPGMVILESKDMVNWSYCGHVYNTLSWDDRYDWDQMNGYYYGVWAGDLAYHDGMWYCYQIDASVGLLVSTAEDIKGPWSKPHLMITKDEITNAPYCDDPAVYWDDEERQAYLGLNSGLIDDYGTTEIRMYKMSWDGKTLLDEGTTIYAGSGAEALKIYKIDGQWYLFFAEWFYDEPVQPPVTDETRLRGDRKQSILRSKTGSIYGPYDKKISLQKGNGIKRSCSQGALIQAPDQSWWYTHQLIQNIKTPFEGRTQMLEPVNWIDGWPIIGIDVNGDGIGEPVVNYKKPIAGYPIVRPQTDDEFDRAELSLQWEWNHNPRETHWSLTDRQSHLRITASVPVRSGGFFNACNTLSQRVMGTGQGTATLKMDTSGMAPGQKAGFVRFGIVYNMLGVLVDTDGIKRIYYQNDSGRFDLGPVVEQSVIYIRSTNDGNQAKFFYSYDDQTFIPFGPLFTLKYGQWTGDRLGLFSYNDITEKGHVDFDWFHYEYYDEVLG